MNKLYKLVIVLAVVFSGRSFSQICNSSGNLVIYSNYDGGIININCDVNIPNLKIGICTYEAAEIHIIGTFSNNVTGVIYAGYDGTNDNCNLGVTSTSIIGASSQSINIYPAVGAYSPVHGNGSPIMVGCYQCDTTTNSGGVNSPDEVVYYFLNEFPGSTLRLHHTQYGCWLPTTFNLSAGGNCCIMPAGFSPCVPPATPSNVTIAANQNICSGSTTTLAVTSTNTVNWYASSTSTAVIGTGNSFVTNTLSTGNYTFYSAATNTCATSAYVPVTVTVNPLPSLTVSASQSSICQGQPVVLSASGANTYTWGSGGPSSQTLLVSPASTSIYTVFATSAAGCQNSATLAVNVVTCTSLSIFNSNIVEFTIFPNPAKNTLNVRATAGKKVIEISDLSGKLVFATETELAEFQIDSGMLAKGMYVFTMTQQGIKHRTRLVIE